ncbi:aldehyde dehydrogenase [Aestuariirhabdus sp. Z084]|uniref:aldehyde dehydrogenase n=1 Tax=Aestuariirhabdus haliotis TaxID=2918751 RepID=UPI00201B414C|nr:aldehyde dehydrogenase [Aestuariirhabdus haliotis]MCL6416831.1 aldehyde dehydrogenase [Aestuariirhabdus haliotis]MCL6420831.1 aldehyde dehydrogenase [Aestuariirhabdus haliotis]
MSCTKEHIFDSARDGKLVARALIDTDTMPQEEAFFDTLNPFDNSVIGQVQRCDTRHVNAAVEVARSCFESGDWSRLSPSERKIIMQRWAALVEQHSEELAALDCVDGGKPISECLATDIPESIQTLSWYAEAIDKLFGKVAPTGCDTLAMIVKEPVGVVAAILPWNFPALMFVWKVAPALVAGNSVIVKPAEQTSLSAYRLVQLAYEAGIPAGALSLVTGFGEEVGHPLGLHQDIDMASFTGSTEVGRLFLGYAAQSNLKGIVLECGGKSPQVIFQDAYALEEIADDILSAAFWNMGENCSCGSRLIVHRTIKDELLSVLKARLASWKVGNPQDPDVSIGPMVEQVHFDKVCSHLENAKAEGARLVWGGRLLEDGAGMCIEPTIFDDVTPQMTLFQEEVFGPVLAVTCFDSEEEAIALANDTDYGLAASLYTADVRRAHRVSRAIRAGTVSVNCFSEGDISTPFGGYKQSGFGGRDNGAEAFEQYVETKTIWYAN